MAELIPLARIEANPFQPRLSEDPDHVRKIAESIGQHGLLQNPVGRYVDETGKPVLANAARVQIAFGHTRLAAFRLLHDQGSLGYGSMPIEIRNLNDQEMFEMTISENLARKDLTPIEEARAMTTYRDRFGKTSDQIGKLFNIGGSAVRNKMRLLDLPEIVQAALGLGTITEGLARSLLALYDLPDHWRRIATTSEHNPIRIEQRALAGEITPAGVYEEVEAIRALFVQRMDLPEPKPQPAPVTVSVETPKPAAAPAVELVPEPEPAWIEDNVPAPIDDEDDETGPDGPNVEDDPEAEDGEPEPEFDDDAHADTRPAQPARRIDPPAPAPRPQTAPVQPAQPAPVRTLDPGALAAFSADMARRVASNPIARPTWSEIPVVVTITYMPVDAAGDRPVIVAVRAGNNTPAMLFGRENQALLSGLPADMLDEVRHNYELNQNQE